MNSILKDRLAQFGTLGRCALLALLIAIALVVAMPVGFWLAGGPGIAAAVVAAVVVWFASALSLMIGEFFHASNEALTSLLFGMLLRVAVPLAACLLVYLSGSTLAKAGFAYFVLGFYFIALPVDTVLVVSKLGGKSAAV
ncbi:MAG: hypothetical protein IT427_12605 [Pirellulales bacterium]|nr:hypothetical protein [Pirellulales bacterium]